MGISVGLVEGAGATKTDAPPLPPEPAPHPGRTKATASAPATPSRLPVIDFLRGDAANGGVGGGRPRHTVAAQAGYFNEGFGARFSASYRIATSVTGGANGNLHFAPLATFDLRLFYNPGEDIGMALKLPWLSGTSIRLEISNVFDAKQRVRDQSGMAPLGYQADLINPIGPIGRDHFQEAAYPDPLFPAAGSGDYQLEIRIA